MDEQPAPPRPSDVSVRLALHRIVDAINDEAAWVLLRLLEAWLTPPDREPHEGP